jgi:hypothetical protein
MCCALSITGAEARVRKVPNFASMTASGPFSISPFSIQRIDTLQLL